MKHTTIAVDRRSPFSRSPSRSTPAKSPSDTAGLPALFRRAPAGDRADGGLRPGPPLGRQLQALGHRVPLLPPQHTRPYVTGNKTDRSDAKGLLEAQRNEQIQPVPVQSAPFAVIVIVVQKQALREESR